MDSGNLKFPGLDIDIKDAQRVQLEILIDFDKLCKAHDIKYQLFSGTLIGAIRHNGFIPWDDDVDVCMLREEYDKFLAIGKTELGEEYFIQNYMSDPNFQSQYTKIRKNNTRYVEYMVQDVDIHHGIFIDVFPYDNVKLNTFTGNLQRATINKLKDINYCRVKRVNQSEENRFVRAKKNLTHYILKVVPKKSMDNFIKKLSLMSNDSETKYVAELGISTSKAMYEKFTLRKEVFYNSIEWEFEGYKFPVPKEYDYVLTKNYGDYMSLPPIEEQQPHHGIVEVNFDTTKKLQNGEKEYEKHD